jgi:hypothetical protein
MAPTHILDDMVANATASVSDSMYQLMLFWPNAIAYIISSILQMLIFIDSSMHQLMLPLRQYGVYLRGMVPKSIEFASSSMSQLPLFIHALVSGSLSQLLLFFHPHEVTILAFGILSSVLIPASFLCLVLPEIEEDYHLFPNEVDFEAEDFPLNTHRFLWVGFGVTLLLSKVWPILDLVDRVSKRFTGYGVAISVGVSQIFASIGYLFAVHDPQDADRGHPLIRAVEDTTLASMETAYDRSKAVVRIAFSQVKKYVWRSLQGLLSYITEDVVVVGMRSWRRGRQDSR